MVLAALSLLAMAVGTPVRPRFGEWYALGAGLGLIWSATYAYGWLQPLAALSPAAGSSLLLLYAAARFWHQSRAGKALGLRLLSLASLLLGCTLAAEGAGTLLGAGLGVANSGAATYGLLVLAVAMASNRGRGPHWRNGADERPARGKARPGHPDQRPLRTVPAHPLRRPDAGRAERGERPGGCLPARRRDDPAHSGRPSLRRPAQRLHLPAYPTAGYYRRPDRGQDPSLLHGIPASRVETCHARRACLFARAA